MQITPRWVGTFETGLKQHISRTSERIVRNLIWDRFVDVNDSQTLEELYFFLLETACIRPEGRGGNKRFDDQAATFLKISNGDFGDGLRLTKNEIQDNVMADPALHRMPAMSFAESWAKQMGALSTRWPQDEFFRVLFDGETLMSFDNVPLFSKNHPVNVFRPSSGTYANIFTGAPSGAYPGACPIDDSVELDVAAANFAKAVAYVQTLRGPNGKPRNLRVASVLGGEGMKKRLFELLETKLLTLNGIENVISRYGIEPVIATEIPITDKAVYLACEWFPGEGGPVIYQNRESYKLSSYSLATLAELQRAKRFEWSFDGRNGIAPGHPQFIYKLKAS